MSEQSDDLKFSQESLSLLLTGGATGVPLEHHIPLSSGLYSPEPNLDLRLPRTSSMSGFPSTSYPPRQAAHSQPSVIPIVINQPEQEIRTDNHPGSYDFNLKFEERSEYPKNHPHCYSRAKDTLIVKDHVAIPFTFTSGWNMKELRMRIRAVFSSKDNFSTPVLPCNNHAGSSQGMPKEFVSCTNPSAMDVKESDRHHILLPLQHCRDVSGNGTELVENFEFNCRSSCSMKSGSKGINNRALSLIFQLETNDGLAIGRRVISLKVAVSPGRDIMTLMKQDSGKRSRKRSRADSAVSSSSAGQISPKLKETKLRPKSVSSSHKYTVVCRHRRTQKLITTIARYCGGLDEVYLGDEPYSQTSVGTQENGSQPDQYSLQGWLTRYGLECYTQKLEEGGFGSPTSFQCLQESDLDKLEVFDKCHRLTLLHAAKRILIRGMSNIIKGEC